MGGCAALPVGQEPVVSSLNSVTISTADEASFHQSPRRSLKGKKEKQPPQPLDLEALARLDGQLDIPDGFADIISRNHCHERIRDLFVWQCEVGHGTSASVHRVEFQSNVRVVKQMAVGDEWSRMRFITEAQILSKLQLDAGIVGFHGVFLDNDNYYMLLEACDFDLHAVLQAKGRLSERKTRRITLALLRSLAFMHERNIAHRDIKPENIVFVSGGTDQPKLIDFGDAEVVQDDASYTELVGTPPYLAPERVSEHSGWQLKKGDVWAVAVIAFEMYCGERCFKGDTQKQVFGRILRGKWSWPEERTPSPEFQTFVKKCLNLDAKQRCSAEDALKCAWFDEMTVRMASESCVGDSAVDNRTMDETNECVV